MKILDRYILKEMISPFLMALGGFIIFMVADIMFLMADQIINKGVPVIVILQMLVLKLPAILVLTFPVALLFSTMLGLGNLSSNYEIAALRTSGVSFFRIMAPVFAAGIFFSFLTIVVNEKISPWAFHKSENIVRRMIVRQAVPFMATNVFFRGPENKIFYVGSADKNTGIMYNVMVFDMSEGRYPQLTTASEATYDLSHWYLRNGTINKFDSMGRIQYEVAFRELTLQINVDPAAFFAGQKTPFEMTMKELGEQVKLFDKSGINVQEMKMDLYLKLSVPFACLITCLIGAPLSVRFPRGGRLAGIAVSITIIFIYYALLSVGRALGKNGMLNPFMAAWLPNIIIGVLGIYLVTNEQW
ncbi:MAG: LptF/LptG family permease [Firmicutes bacterium]|nr:LptF/LptG family permease [Bacillota bacterium]